MEEHIINGNQLWSVESIISAKGELRETIFFGPEATPLLCSACGQLADPAYVYFVDHPAWPSLLTVCESSESMILERKQAALRREGRRPSKRKADRGLRGA